MDILKPVKRVIDKVKDMQDKVKEEQGNRRERRNEAARLEKWKNRLNRAMEEHERFREKCAEWDELYHGTKQIAPLSSVYMSNKTENVYTQDARTVVNIIYQLLEGEIDLTVPQAQVDAIEDADDLERRKMIEGMLTYMSNGPELERIVSENERIVKKNGMAVLKVTYDPDFKSHKFRGKIDTINPHPTNIIPQPGAYRIKDMDYLFHIENRTIDQVCRTYGNKYRAELEDENAEFGYLEDFSDTIESVSDDITEKVSVVECWYKDEDNDVCLLTWCNDVILKDTPKFFYKRGEGDEIIEREIVEVMNIDPITGMQMPTPVEVDVHVPKQFPFIIWYNIPREKSFRGKSDVDTIKDEQEGIKKMLSIQEEKLMKGTTKIITRRGSGLKDKLTNAVTQILETDDPSGDVKVVDLKTPDSSLIELYGVYVQAAKDCLGITEASQGRSEGSTLSGKALELLAQNTQTRMSTKMFEKNIAFKELYSLYFDFLLAFYDDKVPYRVEGKDNKPEFGWFDKGKLVKQDSAGEWYYPEFDIFINANGGLPKDKTFIIDTANQAIQMGAIDGVDYWTIMDSIGFPNASFILERAKAKYDQQMQLQDMQNQQRTTQNELNNAGQVQKMQQMKAQSDAQNTSLGNEPLSQEEQILLEKLLSAAPPEMAQKIMQLQPEGQRQFIEGVLQKQQGNNQQGGVQ